MLRVTVELVPFGQEDKARKIGEMVIGNDLGYDETGHSYQAMLAPDDWNDTPAKYMRLKGYDRSQSVWDLIFLLLKGRNKRHKKDKRLFKLLQKRLGLLKEEDDA